MRYLSIILSLALLLTLAFFCAPNAYAEEAQPKTDWASYDWQNFSIIGLDDSTWDSMCEWFRTDGDLHTIFFVAGRTDGYFATDISYIMSQRFMSEPEATLYALAKEDTDTWKHCGHCIIFETYDWDAMIKVLESVRLSGADTQKGYEILAYMIDYAQEEYKTEIHNPKTGDFVDVLIAVLAISGLFGGVLLTQKKRFV